jgi:hypothetical protein
MKLDNFQKVSHEKTIILVDLFSPDRIWQKRKLVN